MNFIDDRRRLPRRPRPSAAIAPPHLHG